MSLPFLLQSMVWCYSEDVLQVQWVWPRGLGGRCIQYHATRTPAPLQILHPDITESRSCVSQFLSLWQNTWDKQLKTRKGLFWLTVSEVSAHCCLVLSLWACFEVVDHGGSAWRRKLLILWQPGGKNGEGKWLGSNHPFKDTCPVT
jgi:hypothetical protein